MALRVHALPQREGAGEVERGLQMLLEQAGDSGWLAGDSPVEEVLQGRTGTARGRPG